MSRVERRLRKRRRRRGVLVMLLMLVLVSGAVYEAARLAGNAKPKVEAGRPVTVTISPGEGSVEIGRALADAGVVESVGRFRAVAAERGLDAALKPGTYQLTTGMDIDAVLDILTRGPSLGTPFTIPEGFTVAQIVDRIAATHRFTKAALVKALRSKELIAPFRPKKVSSLEGLLFPETYYIKKDATPESVLQDMLDQLQEVVADYPLDAAPERLSPYQVLIVASMIEREAKLPADRAKVARVIYNRLHVHKPLQIDATIEYALGGTKARLSDADLHRDTPYNTYLHLGLPPTPIASPGAASIKAALAPANGPWLYYVLVSADGRHQFTASFAEFQKLKAQAKAKGLL
jgi:UPF0755 protein